MPSLLLSFDPLQPFLYLPTSPQSHLQLTPPPPLSAFQFISHSQLPPACLPFPPLPSTTSFYPILITLNTTPPLFLYFPLILPTLRTLYLIILPLPSSSFMPPSALTTLILTSILVFLLVALMQSRMVLRGFFNSCLSMGSVTNARQPFQYLLAAVITNSLLPAFLPYL